MQDHRRDQLERILASPQFAQSDRLTRFLRYVVEESIAGRAAQIKESTIGVDVFGKPAGYDAKADSTVRSEAVKVRARLAAYYDGAGKSDPWILTIPKGSYVPSFEAGTPPPADQPSSPPVPPPATPAPGNRWILTTATLGVIATAAAAGYWIYSNKGHAEARPFSPPVRITWDKGRNTAPALSAEGKVLAYASTRSGDGQLDIWIRPVSGPSAASEPLRLTNHPADDSDPDISPHGDRVVFRSEREGGGIYVVPTTGGPDRLLIPEGRRPKFSPVAGGRQIVYFTGNPAMYHSAIASGKIYVVDVDGGGPPRQLAPQFAVALYPVWSPDGKSILFLGYRDKDYAWIKLDWWIVPSDGSGQPRRAAYSESAAKSCSNQPQPPQAWSGESVLIHMPCGNTMAVARVTLRDGRVDGPSRQIAQGTGNEIGASIAANGLIAFVSSTSNTDIWSIALAGGSRTPERLTESEAREQYPALSEDDRTLLFMSDRSGSPDIWAKDLTNGASGVERLIAGGPDIQTYPAMELDNRSFVYSTLQRDPKDPVGWNTIVWRKPLDGASPAAKVCEHCLYMGPAHEPGRILDLDGQPTYIASREPSKDAWRKYLAHPNYDVLKATPTPSRRWLAFNLKRDDRLTIMTVPFQAEASKPEQWTELIDGAMPVWSSDGKRLFYAAPHDSKLAIWTMPWDDATGRPSGKPEILVRFPRANERLAPGVEVYRWMSASRSRLAYPVEETSSGIWTIH